MKAGGSGSRRLSVAAGCTMFGGTNAGACGSHGAAVSTGTAASGFGSSTTGSLTAISSTDVAAGVGAGPAD